MTTHSLIWARNHASNKEFTVRNHIGEPENTLNSGSDPTSPAGMIAIARAEALFVSTLSTGSRLDQQQATDAIRTAVRRYRGVHGCAVEMAGAYADAPEIAVRRMRWARDVVQTLFDPTQRPQVVARWAGP